MLHKQNVMQRWVICCHRVKAAAPPTQALIQQRSFIREQLFIFLRSCSVCSDSPHQGRAACGRCVRFWKWNLSIFFQFTGAGTPDGSWIRRWEHRNQRIIRKKWKWNSLWCRCTQTSDSWVKFTALDTCLFVPHPPLYSVFYSFISVYSEDVCQCNYMSPLNVR